MVLKRAAGIVGGAWSLAKIERYGYDGGNMIMTVAYNGSFTGTPSTRNEVLTIGTVNGWVAGEQVVSPFGRKVTIRPNKRFLPTDRITAKSLELD